ncbi:MAG: aspartate/glutamate racemase family protein, partial [Alphaproteobacteria bacterium]|nr:aspartate/glutamate racemase family protein [Alphaproteobacteria bacterium]
MRVKGGKPLYGASVGILMLDAQFPRILGDMGNAGTWPFPVHYKIVRKASPDRVVRGQEKNMLDNFI